MGYSIFCVLLGGVLLALCALGAAQGLTLYTLWRTRGTPLPSARLPPISVLKPLSGADPELSRNLEAFARQDYPSYQLVFGIADAHDPALPVVRAFMRRHPDLAVALCVGAPRTGANPKVSNLEGMLRLALHERVLISDADVRPGPDYLRTISTELEAGIDLVHCIPTGMGQRRLGAILESLHLNCFVAATLGGAEFVRHNCVVGKSMLLRRTDLERVGGFAAVRNVLAEDYVLGQRFRRAGLRVGISRYRLPVVQPRRSLRGFVERHLRWAQMRRWVSLSAFAAEALGNPVGWLLLWLPSVVLNVPAGQREAWGWLALCILGCKLCLDAVMFRVVSGRGVRLWELCCVPLKDLLIACVWLVALFDRRINWRGNPLWIGPGSVILQLPEDSSDADVLRV